MRRLIAIAFLFAAAQAWATFGYYSPLTIQAGQVPGTETDFPILISVTDARLKTVGNGGHVQDAQGDDIRPYTDAGLTTAIVGYEKVFYDGTNGILEMWVKRASVADGLVTYLAYGDASLTTDGSSTTTWSNSFEGVYHFPDGTTLGVNSSTGSNNGTNTNGVTAGAGKIDGCGSFASASNQYVHLGTAIHPAAITLSGWINGTTFPNAFNSFIMHSDGAQKNWQTIVKSNGKMYWSISIAAGAGNSITIDGTGSNTLSTGTWYYITMTFAGTTLIGYVNGSQDATASVGLALNLSSDAIATAVGSYAASSGFAFNGKIDETRIASVARTANWITTEYNNQFAPGTFMVLGTEVPIAAPTNTGAFLQFYP